eukprot:gene12234-15375_t
MPVVLEFTYPLGSSFDFDFAGFWCPTLECPREEDCIPSPVLYPQHSTGMDPSRFLFMPLVLELTDSLGSSFVSVVAELTDSLGSSFVSVVAELTDSLGSSFVSVVAELTDSLGSSFVSVVAELTDSLGSSFVSVVAELTDSLGSSFVSGGGCLAHEVRGDCFQAYVPKKVDLVILDTTANLCEVDGVEQLVRYFLQLPDPPLVLLLHSTRHCFGYGGDMYHWCNNCLAGDAHAKEMGFDNCSYWNEGHHTHRLESR